MFGFVWDILRDVNTFRLVLIATVFAGAACSTPLQVGSGAHSRSARQASREPSLPQKDSCSKPPFKGDVVVASEADLRPLRGVKHLAGSLDIVDTQVERLDDLHCLEVIGGNLAIGRNPSLISVGGLRSVRLVEGYIELFENDKVQVIDFPGLQRTGGKLLIRGHPALRRLDGFAALKHVHGMRIEKNNSLETISGFARLASNSSYLEISQNQQLREVFGFGEIRRLGGALVLSTNTSLRRVPGLSHLEEVVGLTLAECPLESLDDFEGLRRVTRGMGLIHLHELKSLSGLHEQVEVGDRIDLSVLPIKRSEAEHFVDQVFKGEKSNIRVEHMRGEPGPGL